MDESMLQIIGAILTILTVLLGGDSFQQRRQLSSTKKDFDEKLSNQNQEWEQKLRQQRDRLDLREQEASITNMDKVLNMMSTLLTRNTAAFEGLTVSVAKMVENHEQQSAMYGEHLAGVRERNKIQERLASDFNQHRVQSKSFVDSIIYTVKNQHSDTREFLLEELKPVVDFADKFIVSFSDEKRPLLRAELTGFLNKIYEITNGELTERAQAAQQDEQENKPDAMAAATQQRES